MSEDAGEIRWVGDAQRVRLEPGDVVVLRCAAALSVEERARAYEALGSIFPGHGVLILNPGEELGVVGRGE